MLAMKAIRMRSCPPLFSFVAVNIIKLSNERLPPLFSFMAVNIVKVSNERLLLV